MMHGVSEKISAIAHKIKSNNLLTYMRKAANSRKFTYVVSQNSSKICHNLVKLSIKTKWAFSKKQMNCCHAGELYFIHK